MSDRYSDAVLDEKFKNITDKLDEQFEATTRVLKDIKDQTTKTNGSVRNLQLWRQFILGGMTVLSVIVLPTLAFLSFQIIANSNHIAAAEALISQFTAK